MSGKTVGQRLKISREKLNISPREMAEAAYMPLSSYMKYESDRSMPGGHALVRFGRMGIDLMWLLSGETVHGAVRDILASATPLEPCVGNTESPQIVAELRALRAALGAAFLISGASVAFVAVKPEAYRALTELALQSPAIDEAPQPDGMVDQ